jgi:hypothetical protein
MHPEHRESIEQDDPANRDGAVASEDPLNRNVGKRYETPRQYEKKAEDPVMPVDDATLKTKI